MDSRFSIPEITLKSGTGKIPVFGFGTAASPSDDSETIKRAVLEVIEAGYRHFDTAPAYNSEQPLGEAVAQAINRGVIKSRDELFITSKLWCSDAHPQHVEPALRRTLKNLDIDYIDLYLIHWPVSAKPGKVEFPIKAEDFLPMEFESVLAAMEECQRIGLTKAIGVSNFSCKKLQEIMATAKILPACNQRPEIVLSLSKISTKIQFLPGKLRTKLGFHMCKLKGRGKSMLATKELRQFCKDKGILVVAYAPLGAVGTFYGSNRVMESEVLKQIAKAKGKTVAQVSLRWAYELGIGVVVKSFNKERMKQNIDIFDWSLSSEEVDKISEIPQQRVCLSVDFTSAYGPYKTIEELWD